MLARQHLILAIGLSLAGLVLANLATALTIAITRSIGVAAMLKCRRNVCMVPCETATNFVRL
jgi:hypothetical protein